MAKAKGAWIGPAHFLSEDQTGIDPCDFASNTTQWSILLLPMNTKPFPLELQEWQKRCGLTQEKAARALDLCLTTYCNWRSGRHKPNRWAMAQIRQQMAAIEQSREGVTPVPPA